MYRKRLVFIIGILLIALIGSSITGAQDDADARFVGQVPAPEFPSGLEWINVENPLTLDGLQGKLVLLDFWTYGCINCIHMLPVLAQLEEKYVNELVIISVHSAKFENEGQTDNIRQIVQRYDIHHPVVNDNRFDVWNAYSPYGVNAWPTFVLIDPRGGLVAVQSGELPFEAFDQYIAAMIQYYDDLGEGDINREPLAMALEGAGNPGTPLLFPGKVLVDEAGGRLFISDSNHHRIVIADLNTAEVLDIIGTGKRGFVDGDYDTAQFNKLQGLALDGTNLYVADTNNHAIRKVDLEAQTVTTIAGTGEKGRGGIQPGMAVDTPREFPLRSPWDVAIDGDILHIAMAGTHQLWAMDLTANTIYATVGNGRESLINRVLSDSELAQPSGLYFVDGLLYFADSESSSIRVADFNSDEVRTLAGPEIGIGEANERNVLFLFGDVDGAVGESRLQHALDITLGADNRLYVADTYNSKIKIIDPEARTIVSLTGAGGLGGYQDGSLGTATFDEPGGLDYANGMLYVADTNNHVIRVIDLDAQTVSTLEFANPEALRIDDDVITVLGGNSAIDETIQLSEQTIAAGEAGEIMLSVILPETFKINDLIESTLTVTSDSPSVTVNTTSDDNSITLTVTTLDVLIPLRLEEGSATVKADLLLYYCRETEVELCFIDEVSYEIPVIVSNGSDAGSIIEIERTITPPDIASGL